MTSVTVLRRHKALLSEWKLEALSAVLISKLTYLDATGYVRPAELQRYFHALSDFYYEGNMPKAKPQTVEWKGFVDRRLTAKEIEALEGWDMNEVDCFDMLVARCMQGYKLTIMFNGQSQTFNASLTCSNPKDPNAGYTLTAFAPNVGTALQALAFKDEILLANNWENAAGSSGSIG